MFLRETLALGFAAALIALWLWCLFIAYPLVLEKFIKRGILWLYLPLKWKGIKKKTIALFTPVLLLAVMVLGTIVVRLYTKELPVYYSGLIATILIIAVFLLHSLCLKRRFRQQEDYYFHIRGEINRKMEAEGKNPSETEMNNLASFQYQHLLRAADEKGKMLKTLAEQSSVARKNKKTART
jgi:hypothetical protein